MAQPTGRYEPRWDHDLCRALLAVYVRAVLGFLRQRARRDGVTDGRSGAVAMIQRFGGALNLNVHVHALVIDGVFAKDGDALRFHPGPRLTRDDVADVVAVVARRIERLLRRRGLAATPEESGAPDAWSEEAPVLAGIAAASVQGFVTLGPRAGARVQRYGDPPEDVEPLTPGPCHATAHKTRGGDPGSEVRPSRIPGTTGRADPTATDQLGLVLRRAGFPRAVACRGGGVRGV